MATTLYKKASETQLNELEGVYAVDGQGKSRGLFDDQSKPGGIGHFMPAGMMDDLPDENEEHHFDLAFAQYNQNSLLRDPFWLQQFALKKAHREHILASYHLLSADELKTQCFPGWGAGDPVAAMNKRADRHQVLCMMTDGQRLYPIEQFDPKADTPKLTQAFSAMIKAFAQNGGISQEEMLFWLCAEQPLLLPGECLVDGAIEAADLEQGWQALNTAGPSEQPQLRPLDCLKQGDKDTALRLFYDWTDSEQDGPAQPRQELIDAVKHFMAVERISIDDLQ